MIGMMKIISARKRIILVITAVALVVILFLSVFTVIAQENMASGTFAVKVPVRYARDNVFKVRELPGYTFTANCMKLTVTNPKGETVFYVPTISCQIIFADITGDGKPEILYSNSIGSGISHDNLNVYDVANNALYQSGYYRNCMTSFAIINDNAVAVLADRESCENSVKRVNIKLWNEEQLTQLEDINAIHGEGYIVLEGGFDDTYCFEIKEPNLNGKINTFVVKLALDTSKNEFFLSSYRGDAVGGIFEANQEEYYLRADNGKEFVFRKKQDRLEFVSERSDDFTVCHKISNLTQTIYVPDGAKFSPVVEIEEDQSVVPGKSDLIVHDGLNVIHS